jgi:hypothetical protein
MSEEEVITLGSSKTVDHMIVQLAKLKKDKLCADEDKSNKRSNNTFLCLKAMV